MKSLELVTRSIVDNRDYVPESAAYPFGGDVAFKPYGIFIQGKPNGTAQANIVGRTNRGTNHQVDVNSLSGLRILGLEPLFGGRRLTLGFNYYKTDPATGLAEAYQRVILVDDLFAFGHGVLRATGVDQPPTGHEGEAEAWYIRGQPLGICEPDEQVDVRALLANVPPGKTNSYALPRIYDSFSGEGPMGSPLETTHRALWGLQEVHVAVPQIQH